MSLAWYRKWRPQVFLDVVGQDHVISVLQHALIKDRVSHAYLFCGPRGVGKTTVARLMAKAVNCTDLQIKGAGANPCGECACCRAFGEDAMMDVLEIDAASNRGIDDIRHLRDTIHSAPVMGAKKVYIIDEVHMLTKEAFNALLKTLEEPPSHVMLILATTESAKVPATIASRCQRFDFRALQAPVMVKHLLRIAKKEGLTLTEDGAMVIAEAATGSGRDALSLLQQVSLSADKLDEKVVAEALGFVPLSRVVPIMELTAHDTGAALGALQQLLSIGADADQVVRAVLRLLSSELAHRGQAWAEVLSDAQLFSAAEEWGWALRQLRGHPESYLVLGAALLATQQLWTSTTTIDAHQTPVIAVSQAPIIEQKPDTSKDNVSTTIEVKQWQPHASETELWQQLIVAARPHNQSLAALLRDANMLGIEPGDPPALVIGVHFPFHRARIQEIKNRRILEELLEKLTEQRMIIKCSLVAAPSGHIDDHIPSVKLAAPPNSDTDAADNSSDLATMAEALFGQEG